MTAALRPTHRRVGPPRQVPAPAARPGDDVLQVQLRHDRPLRGGPGRSLRRAIRADRVHARGRRVRPRRRPHAAVRRRAAAGRLPPAVDRRVGARSRRSSAPSRWRRTSPRRSSPRPSPTVTRPSRTCCWTSVAWPGSATSTRPRPCSRPARPAPGRRVAVRRGGGAPARRHPRHAAGRAGARRHHLQRLPGGQRALGTLPGPPAGLRPRGIACLRCGEPIVRIVQAGRSTCFCPGCQH